MITQITKNIKYLTQIIYDIYISSISFSNFTCSCGSVGRFNRHGYYSRSIKNPSGKLKLFILRIQCKSCDRTHAILHPSIIPFSQVPLFDTINIISCHEKNKRYENILDNNPEITESDVRYTIKKYLKHWKERILSMIPQIPIMDFIISTCLHKKVASSFEQAFMQIKSCYYMAF